MRPYVEAVSSRRPRASTSCSLHEAMSSDYSHSPLIVFYELTRACNLQCVHCRACAQPLRHPDELTTAQATRLIRELAQFPTPPLVVLTGGDPLKRADVFDLIAEAGECGLSVAMTPSATPLVTPAVIARLAKAGLHRLAVSLDGADAPVHDGFRRVPGSYQRTLQIIADARRAGLRLQINTTVTRQNVHQLDAIAELLDDMDIVLWSVFFLVPTGRAQLDQRLGRDECEAVFARLWHQSKIRRYKIKTTEAPHYRRYVLQQAKANGYITAPGTAPIRCPRPAGTNDGNGVMFVSHVGEIFPSGFLPVTCGRFPLDSPVSVYQRAALFQALRNPDGFGGKCGVCEYRNVCGGSRARAFGVTGDPLAEEPDCAYVPPCYATKATTC
jgi:AdoMet-dependent heme synthase